MIIKKLILHKFKRLALNNIEYLEYSPNQKVQLILGTNGSGKSSLLSELSPLPANHQFYNKDGYKLIIIEYRNTIYELKSFFGSSGNRYSFMKGDEELNPGGTVTVYKELVKQHFNVTQEIHDLLSGVTAFTAMSVSERRNWLTRISDSDYTYAFKYYNSLKEQLRDTQGSLKINQSRLVQESDKLLSPEQEAVVRSEIDNLRKFIGVLLESKQPLLDRTEIKGQLNQLEIAIRTVANQLLEHNRLMSNVNLNDIDVIDDLLINTKSASLSYQDQSLRLFQQIQELTDQTQALEHSTVESITDIDSQIDSLASKVNDLQRQKQLSLVFDSPTTAMQALTTIKDQLLQIVIELPSNSNRQFSRENYERLQQQLSNLKATIIEADQEQFKFLKLKTDLEHARDHQQIECPQCKHIWSKGYDQSNFENLLSAIDRQSIKIEQLNKDNSELELALEAHRSYSELFKQFRALSHHWSILDPLWAHIASESILYDSPKQVIQVVNCLAADLSIDIHIGQLNEQITDLIKVKTMVSNNQELDTSKLHERIEQLNKDLYVTGKAIKRAKNQIVEYEQYKSALVSIHALSKQLEALVDHRSAKANELLLTVKQEALNKTIQLLQLELNQKEQLISKIDIQKGIIENIQASIDEMLDRQELLKIAVKELSPTEGLIAKGLTAFINSFVTHINSFISKVWLYPLELVPVMPNENDDVELDYKFSVKINDNLTISDISKGSSAMKEVIDLAFRITSMHYLGMQDYPILADELGVAFDQAHRKSIFYMISQLMTNASFSQIFLVSHYSEQYGALTNADVNILSASNINVPHGTSFNTCLIMR